MTAAVQAGLRLVGVDAVSFRLQLCCMPDSCSEVAGGSGLAKRQGQMTEGVGGGRAVCLQASAIGLQGAAAVGPGPVAHRSRRLPWLPIANR
jgi:hypothetical protein